ncbi:MAG: hypothetical protein IKJ41_07900 [Clostridia bacterium]|nr:hypothetical protein [Clostridia bacterium]
MMWLTYEEYTAYGGTASREEFAPLELKARKRIDYRTLERIQTPDDDIKLLMYELIGMQQKFDERDGNISGYGNDGVSVSFNSPEAAKKDFDEKANELIDSVVGDLAYRGLC